MSVLDIVITLVFLGAAAGMLFLFRVADVKAEQEMVVESLKASRQAAKEKLSDAQS